MSSPRWRTREDFIQPGTRDTLRNKFGITDPGTLGVVERVISVQRDAELNLHPLPGDFDMAHLQAIHRYLFGDLYEWAGVIRPFRLSKGETEFCRPQFIEQAAADIFRQLARDNWLRDRRAEQFVTGAADLLADLNVLHPFREGNGRAQRAMLSHIAHAAGYRLDWSTVDEQRNIAASIAATRGDNRELRAVIADALVDLGTGSPFADR